MEDVSGANRTVNSLALGEAYLEYCVKKGWLVKSGQGRAVTYELTRLGEKKLANVPFNFDLSKLVCKGEPERKRRRRRR